ncbi:MAG: dephospho-CoA kinase [Acidobacteria bacterium]|nr:dephospho-CoA kinase [Acidobacteriota bacterium]
MLRVGLTGGLASGKSFVARRLGERGCHIIRADDLGHAVMAPGGEAWGAVVAAFGNDILKENGEIDRRRLGERVFNHPARLAALNAVMHPPIFRRQEQLVAQVAREDPRGIAVVEAAIMFESGSHGRYQKIIVAACPEHMQLERAMARDGMTREQAQARLARQLPLAEKVRRADFVIDTSGSKEETTRQTDAVFESLRSIATL